VGEIYSCCRHTWWNHPLVPSAIYIYVGESLCYPLKIGCRKSIPINLNTIPSILINLSSLTTTHCVCVHSKKNTIVSASLKKCEHATDSNQARRCHIFIKKGVIYRQRAMLGAGLHYGVNGSWRAGICMPNV
jgi:hypothetical protein